MNDLKFAWRMIQHHRWFSAAVIVTIALGIGINTTVFTLVNAVLFKPVDVPGGDRLVAVNHRNLSDPPNRSFDMAYSDYLEYREQSQSFESMEASRSFPGVLSEPGIPPERLFTGYVSTGLFDMIKASPLFGRGFEPGDSRPGAEPVAIISYRVWQGRYGGAADVIGRSVRVNSRPTTIVGVAPEGMRFPTGNDVWMPLVPNPTNDGRDTQMVSVYAILKKGVSKDEARAELTLLSERLATAFPDTNENIRSIVQTFHERENGGEIRIIFLTMLGAVGFVLLIACANVANMLLSRAFTRSREVSIRAAMGATRWQIVRQLLIESVLLSCMGGVLGWLLSLYGAHLFDLATQAVRPYWIDFSMNYVAFGYFAAISLLSGIVFGIVPALRASRVDLNSTLKDGARSASGRESGRLTGSLVVMQLSLTVVLLAGAGMMMRSFMLAHSVNQFVPAESILTARLNLPEGEGDRYADPAARRQFFEELMPKLKALPGVTHAAAGNALPGIGTSNRGYEIESHPNENPEQVPNTSFIVQTPDYLSTIQLPVILGRGFDETDGEAGKANIIVTRKFAEAHWPDESAIGQRLRFAGGSEPEEWMTVIGVTADFVHDLRRPDAPSLIFVTHRGQPWGYMNLLVRTTGDPSALAGSVRSAVQSIDQDLALYDVAALPAAFERANWFLSVFGTLFSVFAAVGLLMASVGIYAVVAQSTARRTREIGIRMALGSTTRQIIRLVLSRGVRQLSIGLVLGLVLAFLATNLMQMTGLLVLVTGRDPWVYAAVPLVLVTVGLFACFLPARRAARINPVEALRNE